MKSDLPYTQCSKTNSKWSKDLRLRCETIKILEENTGESSMTLILAMSFRI
jgi:hypothetical protein